MKGALIFFSFCASGNLYCSTVETQAQANPFASPVSSPFSSGDDPFGMGAFNPGKKTANSFFGSPPQEELMDIQV